MPTHTRWRFLAEAGDLLDGSLDYNDTLANVARSVLPRLADCAVIALTCSNGRARVELAAHRNAARNGLVRAQGGAALWSKSP